MASARVLRRPAGRCALAALLAYGVTCTPRSAGAAALGRRVTDARYSIAFNLPSSWRSSSVTTTNTAITKLQVFERDVDKSDALIRVDVVGGRQLSAARLASALGATTGVKVLGSKVVTAAVGKVEQLTFTERESKVLVYGTIEGFYRSDRTYYVVFESPLRSIADGAIVVVMGSWGR